jgi:exonuclease SbcC
MKPIHLRMRAFGPFAAEQTIDFRELGERTFFLVHGPTGAGKTTVLDAICFALYGESTGDLRQPDHFRSTHAEPEDETEVVLDFALGRERYRVQRKPAQERAKRRGSGTTRVAAEATLWRRTACASDAEEGVPLATQPKKVTDKVESLLGFESEQFRQVVVLPQGEFRRLLVADSKDREAILERLFDVARYQRVQDSLKQSADALRRDYERRSEKRALLLEQAAVASGGELVTRLADLTEGVEAARTAKARSAEAAEAARRTLEQGRDCERRLAALREAEQKCRVHGERAAEFANLRERFEAAKRAEPVQPLADVAQARDTEHSAAALAAEQAAAALERTTELRAEALRALEAERARGPERERAAADSRRLEALAEGVEALEAARGERVLAEQRAKLAEEARSGVRRQLEEVSAAGQALATAERAATARAAGLEAAEQRVQAAAAQLERVRALAELGQGLTQSNTALARASAQREAAELAVAEASEADAALREAARLGRAVMLARELVSGDPCPVCGAEHHPAPATSAPTEAGRSTAVPDDQSLRGAEHALNAAREQLRARESAHADAASKVAGLRGEVDALERAVRSAGAEADTPERWRLHYEAEQTSARDAEGAARTARAELAGIEQQRTELEAKARALAEQERGLVEELEQATRELGHRRGVVTEQEQRISEELRAPGALEVALRVARELALGFEEALSLASEAASDAETAFSVAHAQDERERKHLTESAALWQRARSGFDQALAAAGFPDARTLLEARLDDEARAALEQRLRVHDEAGVRLEGELRAARAAAEGLSPLDLPVLEEADAAARAAADGAAERLGAMEHERVQLVETEKKLGSLGRDLDALDGRHSVLGRLSEVANGNNARKLTFQRFVLAAFLDEVLVLASQSLRLMTHGRYALRRTSAVRDKRAQAGLDLVVDDAYTGDERSVATLSGGESFLAALALALGLADVVQRHAGGIHLEAIFIDEGFGSLDTVSLDLAVRTLLDLQRGGRMVGVISHVSELRERIDTRLELRTDRTGSRADFVLG